MIQKPQFEEMLRRAWTSVSQATGINNDSESGFAINILRVFCQELMNLWDELEYVDTQGLLSSATGANLDRLGQFFGVTRRSATAASTLGTPSSVKFTNNGVSTISIPTNTRVWPSENPQIAYFTVTDISIPAGQQSFVDVKAASPGEFYNVGANKINRHSAGLESVTVVNETPITNGADIETDQNYRLRIQNEIYRREGANLIDVREALREVPGVRDVQILNLARGTGTIDVLIYGYDRVVPQAIIDECQRVLEETVAAGVSAIAKAPVVKFVDVDVRLRLKPQAVPSASKAAVSAAIRGYLDNLPIEDGNQNGSLIFQELASRVQESTDDIIDSDVKMTIDDLPALKANQTLEPGERFVSRTITIS